MIEFLLKKLDEILTSIALVNKELLKFKVDATNFTAADLETKIKVGGLKAKKMAYEIQFQFVGEAVKELGVMLSSEHESFLQSVATNIGSLVDIKDGKVVYNSEIEKFLKAKNG